MPKEQQNNTDPDLLADRSPKELYHDELEDDSGQLHPSSEASEPDTDIVEGDLKNDAVLSGEFVSDLITNPQLMPEPDKSPDHNDAADNEEPTPPKMDAHKP